MNYIVLYEATDPPAYPWLTSIITFAMLVVFIFCLIKFWKRCSISTRALVAILTTFVFLVFLSINALYLETNINSPVYIWREYKNGNYKIVEGVIECYEERQYMENSTAPDNFTVDGVYFNAGVSYSGYGYPLRQVDGGKLKNGQKCIIHYIETGAGNVIMKLQIEE